jgi:mutator protein MutT
MKRDYPDRPIVGVGAVIVEDGRVLVVKRATQPAIGQWSIPGGVVEVGETLRQAVVRETQEETGLLVEAGDMIGVFDNIFRDPEGCAQYHYVLVDFLCRRQGGELLAASDASAARWVSAEELEALQLVQNTENVIRKALHCIETI